MESPGFCFGWTILQELPNFRVGGDTGGKRGYDFWSHVLEKGWDPVNRRGW